MGNEKLLKERGVEVVVVDSQECKDAMARFIREQPALWWVFHFLFFYLVFADVFWWVGMRILVSSRNIILKNNINWHDISL